MFEKQIQVPSAEEVLQSLPLPQSLRNMKAERDALIKDVIAGRTEKLLVIVGPCSAHESAPVLEYVRRLGELNKRVSDKLVLVPRIYTNKPRSRGVGYMGMFSQPHPETREDILHGIQSSRELHIRAMEASGLSAADELLYPESFSYVEDLISYTVVGARSSENQMHRLVSSGVDVPVGMKNSTGGSIPALLNSVYAAQSPQSFLYRNWQVKTMGNEYAHAVLRGRTDESGNDIPNYGYETVMRLLEGYEAAGLKNPAVVIDANHSNSGKRFLRQVQIVQEVLQNRTRDKNFRQIVKGFMIESFLLEGCQKKDIEFGKSITDPCLGWEDTERLILELAERV